MLISKDSMVFNQAEEFEYGIREALKPDDENIRFISIFLFLMPMNRVDSVFQDNSNAPPKAELASSGLRNQFP